MFRNTSLAAMPTINLIIGLGLCSIGGAMMYAYFKSRDDETEEQSKPNTKSKQKMPQESTKLTKEVTVQLEVPNVQVPLIVGRSGTNLTTIEENTSTKILFRDKNDTHKICSITGAPDAVKNARLLLLKEAERSPLVKEEISVPQSVCGKIMGRCGEAMQEICRLSLAKVAIDSGASSRSGAGAMDKRRIIITGTQSQVNIARKLIEDKIDEDEDLRRVMDEVEQHREPRRRSPSNSSSMYSSQTSLSSAACQLLPRDKLIAAKANEQAMEVYVSAIASPSKFWLQLIGPQSKKLDELVQTMTAYYSEADNLNLHKISEPYLGQIVAAIFKFDGKWYRAEIVGILPNEFDSENLVLDLYFVDYGDSEYVATHEVYELRTDFLTLRFQAVECFMANVKSKESNWNTQAVQTFEELTQVANWKKLIARVVSYKERTKTLDGTARVNTDDREGSPIPGVELFDLVEGNEVNVGQMLISCGHALPAESQQGEHSPEAASATQQTETVLPSSEINSNAEDTIMSQQIQYLKKNHNSYVKDPTSSNMTLGTHPADLVNGNDQHTTTIVNSNAQTNGNLSR